LGGGVLQYCLHSFNYHKRNSNRNEDNKYWYSLKNKILKNFYLLQLMLSLSVFQCSRLPVCSRHNCRFTASSDVQIPVLHDPLNFLFQLCFGSSTSSFRWPSHYSLRPYVIFHAYYVSILFQNDVLHSFQNCLVYPPVFSRYFISYFW